MHAASADLRHLPFRFRCDQDGFTGAEKALLICFGLAIIMLVGYLLNKGGAKAAQDAQRTLVAGGRAGSVQLAGTISPPHAILDSANVPRPTPGPAPTPPPQQPQRSQGKGMNWGRTACHVACWGTAGGAEGGIAVACVGGDVITVGILTIPCAGALIGGGILLAGGAALCSDVCDANIN